MTRDPASSLSPAASPPGSGRGAPWRPWPLLGAFLLYGALSAVLLQISMTAGLGWFVYPSDAPYLQLSLAEHVAVHGSWGIAPGTFAGASAAPLWTLLLAAGSALAGARLRLPWALDLAAGALLIAYMDIWLARAGLGGLKRLAALAALLLVAPLPLAVLGGGPAVPLALVTLAVVHQAGRQLDDVHESPSPLRMILLPLLLLLLGGLELEMTLLGLLVAALVVVRGDRGYGLLLAAFALIPAVAWSLFAMARGAPLLPAPLLLHAGDALRGLLTGFSPPLMLPTLLALLTVFRRVHRYGTAWEAGAASSLLFALAALLSPLLGLDRVFAGSLVLLSWTVACAAIWWLGELAGAFASLRRRLGTWPERMAGALLLVLVVPLLAQTLAPSLATLVVKRDMERVHRLNMGGATLAARHFPGETVVTDTPGTLAFFSNAHVMDLTGRADPEVLRHRVKGSFTSAVLDSLSSRWSGRLALIEDDEAFAAMRPADWVLCGTWRLSPEADLHLYATSPGHAARVRNALAAFTEVQPSDVTVELYEAPPDTTPEPSAPGNTR